MSKIDAQFVLVLLFLTWSFREGFIKEGGGVWTKDGLTLKSKLLSSALSLPSCPRNALKLP